MIQVFNLQMLEDYLDLVMVMEKLQQLQIH